MHIFSKRLNASVGERATRNYNPDHIWTAVISVHVLLRLTRPEGEASRADS